MSQHATAQWVVTYDISDPRRLARVFKLLKKEGVPVQYSVFFLHASAAKMGALMVKLSKLIDDRCDDIRGYRIPENPWKITLGSAMIPEDLWIDDKGRL